MRIEECATLAQLRECISSPPKDIDLDLLATAVSKAIELGISPVRLADVVQISEATVKRYVEKKADPHPIYRRLMFEMIATLAHFEECDTRPKLAAFLKRVSGKPVSREIFALAVAGAKRLGLTDEALSKRLRVGLGTIKRWESGSTCPVPVGRNSVLVTIGELLESIPE